MLGVAQPVQFSFQGANAVFGDVRSFFGVVGVVPLVFVGEDVAAGCRVVPGQSPVFPAQMQVQDRAVSLQYVVIQLVDGNGNVLAVLHPFPGQPRSVVLAR